MLPAQNRGNGENKHFPDVCLTPPLPGVPVPYLNVAPNVTAQSFALSVFILAQNALNQVSVLATSFGDEAGVLHWTTKGQSLFAMGIPKILVEGSPGISLLCPSIGNRGNAPLGLAAVPSQPVVFYTYARTPEGAAPAESRAEGGNEKERLERSLEVPAVDKAPPPDAPALPEGIGYLAIRVFSSAVPALVYSAIRRLQSGGLEALIIDLRDNPGGEMRALVELAGDFLEPGSEIMTVTDAEGDSVVYRAHGEKPYTFPLVLLVNGGSASAAELFAGCLKSHGRAVIVGERTYGKGVAHVLVPGQDGAGFLYLAALATALPDGGAIHGSGVCPDIEIEARDGASGDEPLREAIRAAKAAASGAARATG